MTLYEALSLLISAIGTLGTVYIGLRQLRQAPPARSYVPAGEPYPAARPHAAGPPYPAAPPQPYVAGPWAPAPPSSPARPGLVTAASLLLYTAATTQPIVFAIYYGIRLAAGPADATRELGDEGFVDVLGFGGLALAAALLGLFIARASRVARALVWVAGAGSAALLLLLDAGFLGLLLDPRAAPLQGFEYLYLGYFYTVLVATTAAAAVLLPTSARTYFRTG
jgi:hypothetical protein